MNNLISNLVEYWYVIVVVVVAIVIAVSCIYDYCKLPTKKQIEKACSWLLYACIEAEKKLGSGTGNIKLRMVYDGFISKFKFLSVILSFEQFSSLVEEALRQMEELLENNNQIREYVYGIKPIDPKVGDKNEENK